MKKYLRIILEVLLAVVLVAVATFAYTNYSGKKHMSDDLTQSTEELDQTKEAGWRLAVSGLKQTRTMII